VGWYEKGYEKAEEQVASTTKDYTREFFLKSGETAKINIVDEDSFNIRDHFVQGKGFFTCIQGIGEENCPLCESGIKATNHFVFNVVDHREYTDKKGVTHKDQVKIWRLGITLLRVLEKKRSRHGAYPTLDVEISKMGQGQSTAYDIEVEKRAKKFVLPEGAELYDMEKVLAPKSRKELLAILNGTAPATSTDTDEEEDENADAYWKKP
jgi:hypothetical protein